MKIPNFHYNHSCQTSFHCSNVTFVFMMGIRFLHISVEPVTTSLITWNLILIALILKSHKSFQSFLDFAVSMVLLLSTLTVKDPYKVHSEGIVGWIECRIWNTKFFLWGLFYSSTFNIIVLTIERSVKGN